MRSAQFASPTCSKGSRGQVRPETGQQKITITANISPRSGAPAPGLPLSHTFTHSWPLDAIALQHDLQRICDMRRNGTIATHDCTRMRCRLHWRLHVMTTSDIDAMPQKSDTANELHSWRSPQLKASPPPTTLPCRWCGCSAPARLNKCCGGGSGGGAGTAG